MNISKETGLIPASFDYEFIDNAGSEQKETINIKLKRITYRKAAAKEFQEALKNIDENPEKVAEFLAEWIDWWSIFLDDEEKEMFPITVENIVERPPQFVGQLSECVMAKLFPNPQKAKP